MKTELTEETLILHPPAPPKARHSHAALLCLHDNDQCAAHARRAWRGVAGGMKLETLQSRLPAEGDGRFRWAADDEAENRLAYQVDTLRFAGHRKVVLGGTGTGCDVIIRGLVRPGMKCEAAVLAAPWMPGLPRLEHAEAALAARTRLLIICGLEDEACLPGALRLAAEVKHAGGHCEIQLIHGLGHALPQDFTPRATQFLLGL